MHWCSLSLTISLWVKVPKCLAHIFALFFSRIQLRQSSSSISFCLISHFTPIDNWTQVRASFFFTALSATSTHRIVLSSVSTTRFRFGTTTQYTHHFIPFRIVDCPYSLLHPASKVDFLMPQMPMLFLHFGSRPSLDTPRFLPNTHRSSRRPER